MFAQLLAEALVGAGAAMVIVALSALSTTFLLFVARKYGWIQPSCSRSGGPR